MCVSLPDVELQGGLLHALDPSGEGQPGLTLDLARHHQHLVLQRVDVVLDVVGHHPRPVAVVPAVGQQRDQYLEAIVEQLIRVHGGPNDGIVFK